MRINRVAQVLSPGGPTYLRIVDVLKSMIVSAVIGGMLQVSRNLPTIYFVFVVGLIAFILLMLVFYFQRQARENATHFMFQGEEIDYSECGFGIRDDPDDETGRSIFNTRRNWALHIPLGRLGPPGGYVANFRYVKLRPSDGSVKVSITYGPSYRASVSIALKHMPENQYIYADMKFRYDGKSSVFFSLEPLDNSVQEANLLGFDRVECYYLKKGHLGDLGMAASAVVS